MGKISGMRADGTGFISLKPERFQKWNFTWIDRLKLTRGETFKLNERRKVFRKKFPLLL
jgi:hypothetical protein